MRRVILSTMWISKRFYSEPSPQASEIGTVTVSRNSGIDASATVHKKSVDIYAPYGYSFSAPKGEEVLLVGSSLGSVGSGTRMKNEGLSAGEIAIASSGGARIVLKNDGTVSINGMTFSKDGSLMNKKGDVVIK